MNFLAARLVLWFVTLAVFPVPVTVLSLSFQVEVLQRITLVPLPQERTTERTLGLERERTERVQAYLEQAEKKEIDPWLRDDLRIAWITVGWAERGVPEWSWHRDSPPHVAATYQVLNCAPDEVWPRILAARKVNLGAEYSRWYGDAAPLASSPKKPCVSERRTARRDVREKKADSKVQLAA